MNEPFKLQRRKTCGICGRHSEMDVIRDLAQRAGKGASVIWRAAKLLMVSKQNWVEANECRSKEQEKP